MYALFCIKGIMSGSSKSRELAAEGITPEAAFEVWYNLGPTRSATKVCEHYGNKMSPRTVDAWRWRYDWRAKAAVLDAKAADLVTASLEAHYQAHAPDPIKGIKLFNAVEEFTKILEQQLVAIQAANKALVKPQDWNTIIRLTESAIAVSRQVELMRGNATDRLAVDLKTEVLDHRYQLEDSFRQYNEKFAKEISRGMTDVTPSQGGLFDD